MGAVDKKEAAYPELWLWHVPGTRWGVADWLAYDEASGFPVASGLVDPGLEWLAEAVEGKEWGVSHGMPRAQIERDPADLTVITGYTTVEISPLPQWAAANTLAGFNIMEVKEMAIPDAKRQVLVAMLGEDTVKRLEDELAGRAEQAKATGVESKELGTVKESEGTEAVTAPESPRYATGAEVGQAIASAVTPLQEQLVALTTTVAAMAKQEAEMKQSALCNAVIGSVIGTEEAKVDGRSELAKSGPKAPVSAAGPTAIPFVNALISGGES